MHRSDRSGRTPRSRDQRRTPCDARGARGGPARGGRAGRRSRTTHATIGSADGIASILVRHHDGARRGRRPRARERQDDLEPRPRAFDAVHLHGATVSFRDRLHDGQPQAEPAGMPASTRIGARESIEDPVEVGRRDPRARVADPDHRFATARRPRSCPSQPCAARRSRSRRRERPRAGPRRPAPSPPRWCPAATAAASPSSGGRPPPPTAPRRRAPYVP